MKTRYLLAFVSVAMAAASGFAGDPANDYGPYWQQFVGGQWAGARLQGWADYVRDKDIQDALRPSAFDVNHDGRLDEQEFAAWDARVRSFVSEQPALMKRFDLNHDGRLDDAEWDAAFRKIFEAKRPVPASTKK